MSFSLQCVYCWGCTVAVFSAQRFLIRLSPEIEAVSFQRYQKPMETTFSGVDFQILFVEELLT
jgi:hypothetical protein